MKKHPAFFLLIAIPATAVLMGIITMVLAFQGPDQEIRVDSAPLSKTSWLTERKDQ